MRPRRANLFALPNALTLARLPLAAVFPLVAARPPWAVIVLATAALTDVLDGYLARERHLATPAGSVLDPVADKVFAVTVVVTLLMRGALPAWATPLLLARELLEAPLLVVVLLGRRPAQVVHAHAGANRAGKNATVVQYLAILAALVARPALVPLLALAGVTGALAGLSYWRRELDAARRTGAGPLTPPRWRRSPLRRRSAPRRGTAPDRPR